MTLIELEIIDKLAVISFNRPSKKNAINKGMYTDLANILDRISADPKITMTVLTGTGEYYSSGTDITIDHGEIAYDQAMRQQIGRVRRFVDAFINHSKLLVAVVNGPAVGIAVTTLALCDTVYAIDTATFHTPFTKLGLVPEACSSYTFPKIMGHAKANEMLLLNRKITAAEAYNWGLVAQVYTKDDIKNKLWPKLKNLANDLPPESLRESKRLSKQYDVLQLRAINELELKSLEERLNSSEFLEIAAKVFFQKRSKL